MLFNNKDYYDYDWARLWDFHYQVQIGVEAFKLLGKNQEESLKTTKNTFDALVENELNDLTPDMRGSYYGQFFESEAHAIDELTRQQRYALCLSIFAFFEGVLSELCKSVEGKALFKIRLEDLNNRNDLSKFWTYLTKVLEIEKLKVEPFFTAVNQQKRTRNVIAHSQGITSQKKRY